MSKKRSKYKKRQKYMYKKSSRDGLKAKKIHVSMYLCPLEHCLVIPEKARL